uniref:Armadillo/beta-catenin repeat family protein n=1 Tax=Rhizophora mucronata TaxID=61149 RepID=A0A2P2PCS8_RHIMU
MKMPRNRLILNQQPQLARLCAIIKQYFRSVQKHIKLLKTNQRRG